MKLLLPFCFVLPFRLLRCELYEPPHRGCLHQLSPQSRLRTYRISTLACSLGRVGFSWHPLAEYGSQSNMSGTLVHPPRAIAGPFCRGLCMAQYHTECRVLRLL